MLGTSTVQWPDARGTEVQSCTAMFHTFTQTRMCLCLLYIAVWLPGNLSLYIFTHVLHWLRVSGSQTGAQEQKSAKEKFCKEGHSFIGRSHNTEQRFIRDDGILIQYAL